MLEGAQLIGPAPYGAYGSVFWPEEDRFLILDEGEHGFGLRSLCRKTAETTPLTAFNTRHRERLRGYPMRVCNMETAEERTEFQPPNIALSPDAGRALWRSGSQWIVATLDGTGCEEWTTDSRSRLGAWLPDSSGWAELVNHWNGQDWELSHIVVRSLGRRSPSTRIPLDGVSDCLVIGTARDGSILTHHDTSHEDPYAPSLFQRLRIHGNAVDVDQWHVPLPGSAEVCGLTLAADGSRLSWLVRAFFNPENPERSDWEYRLLVSGARGENMVQLGALKIDLGKLRGDCCFSRKRPVPSNFCWSPSGVELAFVFDGQLYTRPSC